MKRERPVPFPLFASARKTMSTADAAVLVLADGTVFYGRSVGARACAVGEVVFNTAITGYQEILTDPSYCRQLVTLTYPHIGNTGVNGEDVEAARVYAEGLIVRDVPRLHSNFRAAAISLPTCAPQAFRGSPISIRGSSPGSCAKKAHRTAVYGLMTHNGTQATSTRPRSPRRRHFRVSRAWTSPRS